MAETTTDNEKNGNDHGNLTSESEGKHNPKTSSNLNELDTVNTSGPNKLDRMADTTATYPHDELKNPATSHTTSPSNEHARTDDVDAVLTSDPGESDRHTDSKISYGRGETDLLESVLGNATNETLVDRLLGCAYGQALGDAYGLSTEFETRDRVAHNYPDASKIIPFPDYVLTGHSRRWTQGDWTDDTDQWILILDTLMDKNGNEKMFAGKLTNWIRCGYPDLGDYAGLGLGANVSQVVRSQGYLSDPFKASEAVWERSKRQAAPNGAVMRCSASAFVHFNDLEKVKSTAMSMCKTTHFDPRCLASCLSVCLAIAYLLRGEVDDKDIEPLIERVQKETIEILGDSFPQKQREQFLWHTAKERTLEELNLDESQSIGYTYKCLASGFYGLRSTRSFEKTLNDLIRYGGDADTNGAVCGTMFGARYGYRKLPSDWLKAMPFKKWFDQKIIKCFEQMNLNDTQSMEINE